MKTEDISFLGQGWAWPPAFSPGGREVAMSAGAQDIHESLEILLGTNLGERLMQEDFGSHLSDFAFEAINTHLVNRVQKLIEDAIIYYESRIDLNEVRVDLAEDADGVLLITLDYTIPVSNSRYNLVYPFYLNER